MHHKSGHGNGGCSRKKRIPEIRTKTIPRGAGQHEQPRTEDDEEEISQDDDLRRTDARSVPE